MGEEKIKRWEGVLQKQLLREGGGGEEGDPEPGGREGPGLGERRSCGRPPPAQVSGRGHGSPS